jgi:hypothetical protein
MNPNNARDLAKWIAENQPKVFAQLLKRAGANEAQLGDFMDALDSIGSTVGNAVSSVGSFLVSPDGIKTVATLGTAYLTSQAQRDALSTQVQLAAAGRPLAPIYTASNSSPAYAGSVYLQPNATAPAIPYSAQTAANYGVPAPSTQWIPGIPNTYVLIGGVLLIGGFLWMNRR